MTATSFNSIDQIRRLDSCAATGILRSTGSQHGSHLAKGVDEVPIHCHVHHWTPCQGDGK
jgi:hypothetical protein